MAPSHGRQRKERRDKKQTKEGNKGRSEGEMKIEREVTARDSNMRGDSHERTQNGRDTMSERKRGIINYHQQGKYCFEVGHATMQSLLAPNSFCRTLQKPKRLCVCVV